MSLNDIFTAIEDQIVINSAIGEVKIDAIAEFVEKNIQTWIGKHVLWDLSRMDLSTTSSDEIMALTERMKFVSGKRKGEKTALVSPQDFAFGMSRMYESFAEISSLEINVRTFRSIDEAKKWLLEDSRVRASQDLECPRVRCRPRSLRPLPAPR